MNARTFAGSVLAFGYNSAVGRLPFRRFRDAYLAVYLGKMGLGTSVQMGCRFLNGRKVFLGQRNVINFGCIFDGRRYGIRTGNDVSLGPEAAILTLGHDPNSPDFSLKGGEVTIGNHVWICYRAVVLPGVTIGEGAVIGACSVVTSSVDPFNIVAGSPAKKVGERNRNLVYKLEYHPFLI